jgi:hypothetical protein
LSFRSTFFFVIPQHPFFLSFRSTLFFVIPQHPFFCHSAAPFFLSFRSTLFFVIPQHPFVCHSAAPFCLSFRSAAEESAVVFLLVILAQRRGPRPACWLGWKPESPYLPLLLRLHFGGGAGLQPCESSPRVSAGL